MVEDAIQPKNIEMVFMLQADDTIVGNFLGGNVCKRHMSVWARDLEDGGQMVLVSNRSHTNC